jgi:hypothetical protein
MTNTNTSFNIRVFLDGKEIKPSELGMIRISNATVDRIINDVAERVSTGNKDGVNRTA